MSGNKDCSTTPALPLPVIIGIAAGGLIALLAGLWLWKKCSSGSEAQDLALLSSLSRGRGKGSSATSGSTADMSSYQDNVSSYGGSMGSSSSRAKGWPLFSSSPFRSNSTPLYSQSPLPPSFPSASDPFADSAQPLGSSAYNANSSAGYLNSSYGNSTNGASAGLYKGSFTQPSAYSASSQTATSYLGPKSYASLSNSTSSRGQSTFASKTTKRPGHSRQDSGTPLLNGQQSIADNTDTVSLSSGASGKSGSSKQGTIPESVSGRSLAARSVKSTVVPAITVTRESGASNNARYPLRSFTLSSSPSNNRSEQGTLTVDGGGSSWKSPSVAGSSSYKASSGPSAYGSSYKPGSSDANSSIFGGKTLPPSANTSQAGSLYPPKSVSGRSPAQTAYAGSSYQGSALNYPSSSIPLGSTSGPSTLGGTSLAPTQRSGKTTLGPGSVWSGGSSWQGDRSAAPSVASRSVWSRR